MVINGGEERGRDTQMSITLMKEARVFPYVSLNLFLICTMSTSQRDTITRVRVRSSVPRPYRHKVIRSQWLICVIGPGVIMCYRWGSESANIPLKKEWRGLHKVSLVIDQDVG